MLSHFECPVSLRSRLRRRPIDNKVRQTDPTPSRVSGDDISTFSADPRGFRPYAARANSRKESDVRSCRFTEHAGMGTYF